MTLKKFLFYLLLSNCFLLTSQNNKNYNLLWKIEGNGLKKPSFLFGTMHVRDARAFNFSDSVMISLDRCEAFAMEIHPDKMVRDVFAGMINSAADTSRNELKEVLSKEDYEKLEKKFQNEYGYSIEKLKVKNPYVIKSMLTKSKANSNDYATFVDAHLLGVSKNLNKQIFGLEKTKDQLDFLNSISKDRLRKEYLEIIYPESEKNKNYLNRLTEIYSRGNIYEVEQELSPQFISDSGMVKRNYTMLNSMMAIMKQKTLFTAVGVAHLPGNEGVINLLKKQGYKVTPVASSFTGVAKKYSAVPSKLNWNRFTDSANGFSIESPGAFMDLKMFANLDSKFYFDLTNIFSYGYYVMNMSNSETPLNENKMIGDIIENYKKNEVYSLIKSKQLNKDGMGVREIVVKTSDNNYLRMHLFIRNNILYGLFVGGEPGKINTPEAEKYLNSFALTEIKRKNDPKWIHFRPDEAAFSIAVPVEPKLTETEVPTEEPGAAYKLKLYVSTNVSTMTNYLIRYNDYPQQMYIDNKQSVFSGTVDEIMAANKPISGPDTIYLDGYEGRRFTFKIQDKYFSEARMFVRGNRSYFLLKQNLVADADKLLNDDFFTSFKFEPYKKIEKFITVPEKADFSVLFPATPKIVTDTVFTDEDAVDNTVDFYATHPSSGGLYHFEHADLTEFFKIKSKTEYYKTFVDRLLSYSDTIISSDSITVNGSYGREFVITKNKEASYKRIRVWLFGNKLFYLASYIAKDELFNEENNKIYNSFKINKAPKTFDVLSSKTEKLLSGLKSKDTTVYKKSIGAFEYYEFEKKDLKSLVQALSAKYTDDTLSTGARSKILNAIAELKDTSAITSLIKEFKSSQVEETKISALLAITKTNLVKGLPVYLKLLMSDKMKVTADNTWRIFSPLNDSIEFTKQNFDLLLPLIEVKEYRPEILGVATTIGEADSTDGFIKKNLNDLKKYALADLESYTKQLKDTSAPYFNFGIYDYLLIQQYSNDKEFADTFTHRLLSQPNNSDYLNTKAVVVRLRLDLPVAKKLVQNQLENLYSRYSILKAYEDKGQLSQVSSKYTSHEELGRVMLYHYVGEDDYPEKVTSLGKLKEEQGTYYVYKFNYEGQEDSYLGVSGPFNEKETILLDNIPSLASYEAVTKEWKEQAKKLIYD